MVLCKDNKTESVGTKLVFATTRTRKELIMNGLVFNGTDDSKLLVSIREDSIAIGVLNKHDEVIFWTERALELWNDFIAHLPKVTGKLCLAANCHKRTYWKSQGEFEIAEIDGEDIAFFFQRDLITYTFEVGHAGLETIAQLVKGTCNALSEFPSFTVPMQKQKRAPRDGSGMTKIERDTNKLFARLTPEELEQLKALD